MAICLNCLALIPSISSIFLVTSFVPATTISSYSNFASAKTFFRPFPFFFCFVYVGFLFILYIFPLWLNLNSTNESVLSSAKSLFNETILLLEPLAVLYNANAIASKIVVFPAPVSPVIKNKPLLPISLKSISISSLNGPKAFIFKYSGFKLILFFHIIYNFFNHFFTFF